MPNQLIDEKSPYLLQHADNPVDWVPWGDAAFEKARQEDKPIFLSIGYSTCHWCHVMAHESFEDQQVAAMMNEAFISIKVDREERPDIDAIYMTVCQMMTGAGGWPLTIVMTPDQKPFFAGTYYPKTSHGGRAGMLQLIPQLAQAWKEKREEVLKSAEQITGHLKQDKPSDNPFLEDRKLLDRAFNDLSLRFDSEYGGFGDRPKFPTPHNLLFLLRYFYRTKNKTALDMVEKTLQCMRMGGIFDHVGMGFHRYATDAPWLVPHFEKMLYDQAMIAIACTETWQVTKNDLYREIAEEIHSYVLRDMTDPQGGFYSAEDADSEGEEGKFYVWSEKEMAKILDNNELNLVKKIFNTTEQGNFMEEATGSYLGTNILHLKKPLDQWADSLGFSPEALREKWIVIRKKLFEVRKKRIPPSKDDKILTDWNGLMVVALAKSGAAFDNPAYIQAAEKCMAFLLSRLKQPDGHLSHRFRDGGAGILAHVDDYAFIIWALIELYESTFRANYLNNAIAFNAFLLQHFWDPDQGAFFFSSEQGEKLIHRSKEFYDGAIPSGNSVACLNLLRLARITGKTELETKAHEIKKALPGHFEKTPTGFTMLLCAVDFLLGPSHEVILSGNLGAPDMTEMIRALQTRFIPNHILLVNPQNEPQEALSQSVPFLAEYKSKNQKATAYVCSNYACQEPTTEVSKMISQLSAA